MLSLFQLTLAIVAVFQGALASPVSEPTTLPGHYVCTSLTTVTSTVLPVGICQRQECVPPTKTCAPGEPVRSPFSTVTTTLPACTVEVLVEERCGCNTCVPAPTA
ncbi:uncharacterized protein GGS25DRAFT_403799 [Hypoxylon fragiforme]|uniref:uncharacterized protein n=1 Tax=Hypoxylon fragiforme TaxID=63214 RepID=UPI0020C69157|nr:uncharacterized protein GGS25DRAFT_403799 [Hypoxylon fragiforme]KAI2604915.1 hypothetical protein GGS25DRAFT_403799 [Hypoxylon fragiforme]